MSKTTLADTNGWTPIIDSLAQEYGLTTAAVFGRIWRYCQGERGVCDATIRTISRGLGITYNTTLKHIQILLGAGYIEDRTPGLRYKSHTYVDTGKVNTVLQKKVSELTLKDGCAKNGEHIGLQKMDIRSAKIGDQGIQKKEIKKEDNKQSKRESVNPLNTEIPPSLDTPNFKEAWNDFLRYRREIRKPFSNLSCLRLLTWLAGYPVDTAIQMLDQTIEKGWQGVFEVKNSPPHPKQNKNAKNQPPPDKVLEMLKGSK